MPQIPTFPGVQAQAIPGARLDPSVSSAAFSGNVNKTPDLSPAIAFAEKARNDADQVAVSAADAQLVQAKTKRLWDPQTGAMNARGKDAIPASDAANAEFQKDADEIENTLTDGRQKEAFRRRVDMHYADLGNQLGQHVGNQIKQYDVDTTKAHVDALADHAITSYDNPDAVKQAIADIRGVLTDFGGRQGQSPEVISQDAKDRISAIHAAVLGQYARTGNADAASAYFTANRDEFVGKDLTTAQKIVAAGTAESAGHAAARKIMGIGQPDPIPGAPDPKYATTFSDALTAAEQIKDDDQRETAIKDIQSHFTLKEHAAKQDREGALQRMTKRVELAGGVISKADPDWQTIDGTAEGEQLMHRSEQLLRPPKDPGNPDAFQHYNSLNGLNPASTKEFLSLDIPTLAKKEGMNYSEANRLMSMQRVARTQAAGGDVSKAVEAEKLNFARQTELLKIADPASKAYISDKAVRDAEVSRIKHHYDVLLKAHGQDAPTATVSPSSTSGSVDLRPTNPLAGILTPRVLKPVPLDWQARVLADPKYRQHLANGDYDVDAVKPVAPK